MALASIKIQPDGPKTRRRNSNAHSVWTRFDKLVNFLTHHEVEERAVYRVLMERPEDGETIAKQSVADDSPDYLYVRVCESA